MEGFSGGMKGLEVANPAGVESAEVLQAFMLYPHPLAIVDRGAAVLMANHAWSTRLGEARVVPASLRAIEGRSDGSCLLALHSPGAEGPAEVRVRAIPAAGRILLSLEDAPRARPGGDMDVLRERVLELERMAATDHLTGAWNRAHFDRLIDAEIARCAAIRQPVSIVLLDVDHFKRINDGYGHHVGDIVLRRLARLARENVRGSDFVFRWGGEEFAVLSPNTGYRGAERLAETLRLAVATHPFERVGTVTISLGVAEHCGVEDPITWFERLDGALYAAKDGGRNRVVTDRRGNSDLWGLQAGASPLHLCWQEAFESGNAGIDAEHRELFALANRLIDAGAGARPDPFAFHGALDTLLAHIQRHFANEEAILAAHGYADLAQHARAHQGLLARASRMRAQMRDGDVPFGPVVEFLAQDVVARHLMAADRAFFPLFATDG